MLAFVYLLNEVILRVWWLFHNHQGGQTGLPRPTYTY